MTVPDWVPALAGIVLAGLLVHAWRVSRAVNRLHARVRRLEDAGAAARRDLDAIGAGSLAALERLDRLEPALETLGDRLGPLEMGSTGQRLELAVDAAGHGAGREELMTRFGLSPGEADLVLALHRAGPAPA